MSEIMHTFSLCLIHLALAGTEFNARCECAANEIGAVLSRDGPGTMVVLKPRLDL